MVVKFTFQSVFGNSLQNPRHFSARGREESLELYSILWSDWPTSKQEVLRHGNRFAARVRRRYFSEGEKRRPEMRLQFAGYWFRTGCPFQRRFLERGIIFRTHKSSSFVSSHLKSFKDRLLLKIRFNALANCCTLVAPCVLACRAGIFWREPRALTPPSWINRRLEVWNESKMYPREMETGSKLWITAFSSA